MTDTTVPVASAPPIVMQTRHRMSGAVRAGDYPTCPDKLHMLVAAEDALIDAEATMRHEATSFVAFLDAAATCLADGQPLDGDFAAQAYAAVQSEEQLNHGLLAIQHVQARLQDREWPHAVREHADQMLAGLRDNLHALLDDLRPQAALLTGIDLGDPDTLDDLDDHQRTALAALKAARPRYRRLRNLQCLLFESAQNAPALASNYDANRWTWRHAWDARIHEFEHVDRHGTPAHPDENRLWWQPVLTRTDTWLPTVAELADAWERVRPVLARSM